VIQAASQPTPGINLIGFLSAESGLGEVARRLVGALERTDIPFVAIDYGATASRREHPLRFDTTSEAPYDTTIVCVNADELPSLVERTGVELFARSYTIGVWFWETSVFRSSDRRSFVYVDEVWVPSMYVRDVVAREAEVPVLVMPIPVDAPSPASVSKGDLHLPPGFVFLSILDLVSAERKNPRDTIAAFTRAFEPAEGPTLVVKTINGRERKPSILAELAAAASGRPDVVVRDGYVSVEERDALVAACDCFVSLHRSEGYGLTLAEAMAFGKPVLATGYSGNLEFMDPDASYLVPYELVPVPTGWWAHAPGAMWAQPDVEAAAEAMRQVYGHPETARVVGSRAREQILARYSPERTAELIRERFASARARIRRDASADFRASLLRAASEVRRGVALGASDGAGAAGVLRRATLRLLWPHLEEQHAFDQEVVEALARLERSSSRVLATEQSSSRLRASQ
jgi:glycosyltransferase involved in cell wall biosynthesis